MITMPIREFLPPETPAILQRMQTAVKENTSITLNQDEGLILLEAMTQLIQVLGKTSYVLQQILEESPEEQEEILH